MKNTQENSPIIQEEIIRLKQSVNELTILNDISNAISSTMDLQEIMATIITKSLNTLGVEQGTVMLIEENSEEPMRTMIRGVSDHHRGKIYKLGTQLTGWMIKNRKPLLINDTSKDERFKSLKSENTGVHSILCVPMVFRGKLIGVINLFNKRGRIEFTPDDQKLMCIVAAQVASFLVNALSFEHVKESNEILQKQTNSLQSEVGARYGFNGIIGKSEKIKNILEELESIAHSPASVLISGETGTGKELIAKTIHFNSDRKDQPFVDVNSAAIPENLVESEFFGIEEGVATGVTKRIGLFEQANGGTLFIDEIGDMRLSSQAKILRALEERKIRRVGSNFNINIDIRIIVATNKNLKEEISNKTFREDLYYRLSVFEIELPPLRERREDIPLMLNYFTQKYANQMGKLIEKFSFDAADILFNYDWPGNIRELANVVERAVILAKEPVIHVEQLPRDFRGEYALADIKCESYEEASTNFKRRLILNSLQESNNNKAEAARNLKLNRAYFFRLLKQLGINEVIDN